MENGWKERECESCLKQNGKTYAPVRQRKMWNYIKEKYEKRMLGERMMVKKAVDKKRMHMKE